MTDIVINPNMQTVFIDIDPSEFADLNALFGYINGFKFNNHAVCISAKTDSILADYYCHETKLSRLSLGGMIISKIPFNADVYNFKLCVFKEDHRFDNVKEVHIHNCQIIEKNISFSGQIDTLNISNLIGHKTLDLSKCLVDNLILRDCDNAIASLPKNLESLEVYNTNVKIDFVYFPNLTKFDWRGDVLNCSNFPLRLINKDNIHLLAFIKYNDCESSNVLRGHRPVASIPLGLLTIELHGNEDSKRNGTKFSYSETNGDFNLDTNLDIVVRK